MKTFAQAVAVSDEPPVLQLPLRTIIGDSVRIQLSQAHYEAGIKDCSTHLHGRVTLQKHDSPLTTQSLRLKLKTIWPNLSSWSISPLGRGCFEFMFNSIEDMRRILAKGVINLKPGIMWFSRWTHDFNSQSQQQTHAQIWIRLMHLP